MKNTSFFNIIEIMLIIYLFFILISEVFEFDYFNITFEKIAIAAIFFIGMAFRRFFHKNGLID